jgi:hypothetical protein
MPYCTTDWYVSNRVGIGTDNPGFRLVICDTNNPMVQLKNPNDTTFGVILEHTGLNSEYWNYENGYIRFGTANAERMRITNTGNVGIGITDDNPIGNGGTYRNLLIGNGAGYGAFQAVSTATAANSTIAAYSGGTTGASNFKNAASINIELDGTSTTNATGRITFYTATGGSISERMRITSAGNVGIGTANPQARLEVNDTSNFASTIFNARSDGGYLIFQGCGTTKAYLQWGLQIGGSANGKYLLLTNDESCGNIALQTRRADGTVNSCALVVACTGNVGIGTTSPTTGKLEVAGSILTSGGLVAALANSAALSFESTFSRLIAFGIDASTNGCFRLISSRSDGSNQLTWLAGNASGNVGINCLTPTYKLHVNGTFYAAGSSQDYKQSICNYDTDSCMFMKLKPVTYQYKDEYCHLGKELKSGTQIGLIAEEVAETYPELAILVNEAENKVVRNVDYEKLSVVLLKEVQKLRREMDDLKHKEQ